MNSSRFVAHPRANAALLAARFRLLRAHPANSSCARLPQDVLLYCQAIESSLREENERLNKELQNCRLDLLDATSSRRELQQRLHRSDSQADWASKENESLKVRLSGA